MEVHDLNSKISKLQLIVSIYIKPPWDLVWGRQQVDNPKSERCRALCLTTEHRWLTFFLMSSELRATFSGWWPRISITKRRVLSPGYRRRGVFWPGSTAKLVSIRTLVSVQAPCFLPCLCLICFSCLFLPTFSPGVNCLLCGPGSAGLYPSLASHPLQHLPQPCSKTFSETLLILRPSPRP